MKKKVILKSSILAVAAGLSVFAINSVFADELPVQFMGSMTSTVPWNKQGQLV